MDYLTYIPIPLLLVVTLSACLGGEWIIKHYAKSVSSKTDSLFIYTAAVSAVACVSVFCLSVFDCSASLFTIGLGCVFGVATMLALFVGALALSSGPWSYTTVIITLSTIIPTLSGAIFWDEVIKPLQIVGIVFMFACFILSVKTDSQDKEQEAKASLKWLFLTVLAALATGSIGLLQKVHQSSAYSGEVSMFLVVAFATSAVIAGVLGFIRAKKKALNDTTTSDGSTASNDTTASNVETEVSAKETTKNGLIFLLFALGGVASALNNVINLYLSGAMESAILFPILNGGHLILVTVLSILLYKEKLSLKQWIGLTCGLIAVIMLCI